MKQFRPTGESRAWRFLTLIGLLLVLCGSSTAASLCVSGNTLAQYIAAAPCAVSAGPVNLIFEFDPSALGFYTDGTGTITASEIVVTTVSDPAGKLAGLTFSSNKFAVPADGTWADFSVSYGVSVDPTGNPGYKLASAHLDANMSLNGGTAPDDQIYLYESETRFILNMNLPDTSSDTRDAIYPKTTHVDPNTDVFISGPNGKVTSMTETFDVSMLELPEPGSMAMIGGGLLLAALLRFRRFGKGLAMVCGVVAGTAVSQATTLCADTSAIALAVSGTSVAQGTPLNLAAYEAFGTCRINDMLFTITGFSESHTGAPLVYPSAGSASTPANVSATGSVAPIAVLVKDNISVPGQFTGGFQFIPIATSSPTSTDTFTITFTVQAPDYEILNFNGATGGNVTRKVTITPGTSQTSLTPAINLDQPSGTIYTVTETITVGNRQHISNLVDQFTEQVPEPITSALTGGALLLGLTLRRRAIA